MPDSNAPTPAPPPAARPPLIAAVYAGDRAKVRALLDAGANPDELDPARSSGRTALLRAVELNYAEIAALLLDRGADLNRRGVDGTGALRIAAWQGAAESLEVLLAHGAVVNEPDGQGFTPLMVAAYRGKSALVSRLLEAGADPNAARRNDGTTALHCSVSTGYPNVTRLLLRAGARPDPRDARGRTPLMWASFRGLRRCAELLRAAGADPAAEAPPDQSPNRVYPTPPIHRTWPKPSRFNLGTAFHLLGWALAKRGDFMGVRVRYSRAASKDEPEKAFGLIARALDLIHKNDPRRFRQVATELRGILVTAVVTNAARQITSLGLCHVDDERLLAEGRTPLQVALDIVHETTHARLSRSGFGYEEVERPRIERVCLKNEIAFASRVPGGAQLAEKTRVALGKLTHSLMSDSAHVDRDVAGLRHLGAPKLVVTLLERWARWRLKRRYSSTRQ